MAVIPEHAVLCPVKWRGEYLHVVAIKDSDEETGEPLIKMFAWLLPDCEPPPHELDWPVTEEELLPVEHTEYRWRLQRLLDVDVGFPKLSQRKADD